MRCVKRNSAVAPFETTCEYMGGAVYVTHPWMMLYARAGEMPVTGQLPESDRRPTSE